MGETVGDLEEDRIAIRSNFCSITYQKNTVMIMPKILIVATGIGAYANAILPTGLWLSELTHIYHRAKGLGCKITIASPKGGEIPVDPESLKPFTLDKMSKAYWNDPEFRELLHHAQSLDEVAGRRFDCVYLAGGHGSMYDFPDNAVLQAILKTHFESGKIVSAICHGVCGLLNVGLSDGQLVRGNPCPAQKGCSFRPRSGAERTGCRLPESMDSDDFESRCRRNPDHWTESAQLQGNGESRIESPD